MLKINIKAGGINQNPGTPNPYIAHKDKAICFGVDATDSPPVSASALPIAAIVTNIGRRCFAFGARQEVIENLKYVIKRYIGAFFETNGGAISKNVLYLRDGVSDGQYEELLQSEIKTRLWKPLERLMEAKNQR